jgi:hypothetical protein
MKTKQNWNWKLFWNLGAFLVLFESPWQVRFSRVYFTVFRAKVWKDFFWVDFVVGNSNKLQNWVWKEKSVEPSMCSHAKSRNFQFWQLCTYLFIGNVFTLVPMAQATLVVMILQPHSIRARVTCVPRQSWEFWPLLVLRCRQHSSPVMADVCLLMNRKKGAGLHISWMSEWQGKKWGQHNDCTCIRGLYYRKIHRLMMPTIIPIQYTQGTFLIYSPQFFVPGNWCQIKP